ncbi:NADH-quinone oxidoreductase subunit L [Candidatus Marinimicrobia bacterium PRS2]|nr:NADH-quinone oxidoreductase subunit L [Candidatus Marinimicrobia bacterium PRS2]
MENYSTILALLNLFLPLLSFVILIFFGKKIGNSAHWVALTLIGSSLGIAVSFFANVFVDTGGPILETSVPWFSTGSFSVNLGFLINNEAAIMLLVVALISFLVHFYSVAYMKGDPRYSRYFAYLGIFTFSMNGIVLADNLLMMYIFWELVGLSSYLLIGFWFEKESAADACKKAFLTNRVGDIGMFIGIMILFLSIGTFQINGLIDGVHNGAFAGNMGLLTIAGILVFMGAVGKSAQFPLHIWLPDAMEGPTPVSALIHAATMVAAGVYMLVRIFPILTPGALEFIAVVGGITAIMAAIIAITQNDIKRVLAYSTVSQLGYMIMALGVGAYQAGFFHLTTHAMFKACLFLCSGSVIHAMHHALHELKDHDTDPQDMRNMGGLRDKMPITFWTMFIATLAISGVPFFSGFLSKDAILAGTLSYYHLHHGWTLFLPIAGFGAAVITAFYMFRLIFLTFFGKPANDKVYAHIHESPIQMTFPLILLAGLSFALFFTLPLSVNPIDNHGWFTEAVPMIENVAGLDMHVVEEGIHHAHYTAMGISLMVAAIGIFLAVLFYLLRKVDAAKVAGMANKLKLYNLSFNKFYIDEIYNIIIYKPFLALSWLCSKLDWDIYDQKFIDGWGWLTIKLSDKSGEVDYNWLDQKVVDGFGKITQYFGKTLQSTQNGVVQNYLLGGMLGVLLLIILIQQF